MSNNKLRGNKDILDGTITDDQIMSKSLTYAGIKYAKTDILLPPKVFYVCYGLAMSSGVTSNRDGSFYLPFASIENALMEIGSNGGIIILMDYVIHLGTTITITESHIGIFSGTGHTAITMDTGVTLSIDSTGKVLENIIIGDVSFSSADGEYPITVTGDSGSKPFTTDPLQLVKFKQKNISAMGISATNVGDIIFDSCFMDNMTIADTNNIILINPLSSDASVEMPGPVTYATNSQGSWHVSTVGGMSPATVGNWIDSLITDVQLMGTRWGPPVQSLMGINQLDQIATLVDKETRLVEDTGCLYRYDAESTATPDGIDVILPMGDYTSYPSNSTPIHNGRWVKISAALPDHNSTKNPQGGDTNNRWHLSQTEYSAVHNAINNSFTIPRGYTADNSNVAWIGGSIVHNLGTTNQIVQCYERTGSSPNYTWTEFIPDSVVIAANGNSTSVTWIGSIVAKVVILGV